MPDPLLSSRQISKDNYKIPEIGEDLDRVPNGDSHTEKQSFNNAIASTEFIKNNNEELEGDDADFEGDVGLYMRLHQV